MLIVFAEIYIKPGCSEQYIQGFLKCRDDIYAEQGCIEFKIYEDEKADLDYSFADIPPPRENIITDIEKWDSMADYNSYLNSDVKKRFGDLVHSGIEKVVIRTLEEVAETQS